VPAHAIACTVETDDFGHFDGIYRWNFLTILMLTPPEMLKALLEHPDIDQPADAVRLLAFAAEHGHLKSGIVAKALRALGGQSVPDASDEDLRRQFNTGAGLFAAAVFDGQPHDGAVAEPSALGGLSPPHASTVPHALHSFAPRYPAVQERVIELLEGPPSNFADGFPQPDSFPHRDRPSKGPESPGE
jgi:hypothetical protein